MTQTFSVVTKKCVFHISDRLLSQQTTKGVIPFDRESNKTVIFCARDAHVVASFTGRAYLDHIPTDTFIAQSLLGQPLPSNGGFYSVGYPDSWMDIGRSVERLMSSLTDAFGRLPPKEREANFQVSVVGWRQNRRNKRITPLIWELQRPIGRPDDAFMVIRTSRWWNWKRGYVCSMIPDAPPSVVEWMRKQLREHGNKSPDEIKRVLLEGLRHCVSQRPDTVGKACLQVLLTPTVSPNARIKYIPDVHQPDVENPDVHGYSPWIVTPPMAFSPALIRGSANGGGWENIESGYSWIYEGPIGPAGTKKFLQSSQKRPPDPQLT